MPRRPPSRRDLLALLAVPPAAAGTTARAQGAGPAPGAESPSPSWPSRPLRLIVPYPPGGSADVLARLVAGPLGEALGATAPVIDNRPGGAAVVGTLAAAQAAPDGHTLVLSTNQTHAANPALVADLPYRAIEDFAPVGRVATVHHALMVAAAHPARTLADLAARGRDGGRLTYASSGVGSASHVIAEAWARRAALAATHVPYRGGAQAATDTVAGLVDFTVATWPSVAALARDGRLRCLGHGAPAPLPGLPDAPSFAATGAAELAIDSWFGVWAPARTPADRVARLSDALLAVLAAPGMAARLEAAGYGAAPLAAGPFGAFQREEVARWGALVALTGIRAEG